MARKRETVRGSKEGIKIKIVIINGSTRKGNTLTAIEAFVRGASGKYEMEVLAELEKIGRNV